MFYSPLRYPGGKGKILSFMKEFVELNGLRNSEYVEPYAGGAAVALGLLIDGYVSKIHINDSDKGIFAFWNSILNYTDEFVSKVDNAELNIKEWRKQKEIYNNFKDYSKLEVGFATFYLNRCNYSGVIKGGPIGGISQEGKWKLDARFNKEDLVKRIIKIAEYKSHIKLYNCDTLKLLSTKEEQFKKALLYLDPPYYKKGYQLYKNHYQHNDHLQIAKLMQYFQGHWIVSYDNVPEIIDLYKFANPEEFNISYSAGKTRQGKEIMFFSADLKIPQMQIC